MSDRKQSRALRSRLLRRHPFKKRDAVVKLENVPQWGRMSGSFISYLSGATALLLVFQFPAEAQSLEILNKVKADQFEQLGHVFPRPLTSKGALAGTGIVLTASGKILTVAHIFQSCVRIEVASGKSAAQDASLIGLEPREDLALIQADRGFKLPPLSLAPAEGVGAHVIALGYPLDGPLLDPSQAESTVIDEPLHHSSTPTPPRVVVWTRGGVATRGFSGGPLFDEETGHVVGITTSVYSKELAQQKLQIADTVSLAIGYDVINLFLLDFPAIKAEMTQNKMTKKMSLDDVQRSTVRVICYQGAPTMIP